MSSRPGFWIVFDNDGEFYCVFPTYMDAFRAANREGFAPPVEYVAAPTITPVTHTVSAPVPTPAYSALKAARSHLESYYRADRGNIPWNESFPPEQCLRMVAASLAALLEHIEQSKEK